MAPKLYMFPGSPAVRPVLMTAKAIGLDLELETVDPKQNDHKKPEYLAMNPQHTVPTLKDDDGFVLWDSHAILPYLVEKYAKDDSLYPKDLKKRSVITQRLHFDSSVLFPRFTKILRTIVFQSKQPDPADLEAMYEAWEFLEAFLERGRFVAGDSLSIADFSLLGCVSTEIIMGLIDYSKYPKVQAWIKKMESVPEYSVNSKGLEQFKQIYAAIKKAQK